VFEISGGAVLFECITGRRAFSGKTVPETMTAVLRQEPPTDDRLTPNTCAC
jgi:hypothetical protein